MVYEELSQRNLAEYPTDPGRNLAREFGVVEVKCYGLLRHAVLLRSPSRALRVAVFQDVSELKKQQKLRDEMHAHQCYIATELQRVFLPDPNAHPVVLNYETAAAYKPAHSSSAHVVGDFYDLFLLDSGRIGIVMADASGKDVRAAIYTAMAKYVLRGFARERPEPARLIARLNGAFPKHVQDEVFITPFYGVLDTIGSRLSSAASRTRPIRPSGIFTQSPSRIISAICSSSGQYSLPRLEVQIQLTA